MEELIELEASTGEAGAALLIIARMTGDFSETAGLGLLNPKSLQAIFGRVIMALEAAQKPKVRRKRGKGAQVAQGPEKAAQALKIAEREAGEESTEADEEVNEETGEVTKKVAAPKKNKGGRPKGSKSKTTADAPKQVPINGSGKEDPDGLWAD